MRQDDHVRQHMTTQCKTKPNKTRQGNTISYKTMQDNTRERKTLLINNKTRSRKTKWNNARINDNTAQTNVTKIKTR